MNHCGIVFVPLHPNKHAMSNLTTEAFVFPSSEDVLEFGVDLARR